MQSFINSPPVFHNTIIDSLEMKINSVRYFMKYVQILALNVCNFGTWVEIHRNEVYSEHAYKYAS